MRYFTGGYFLTPLDDPANLRGIRYENAFPMGQYDGKSFTFILFSPELLEDDPQGKHQESFDMSSLSADEIAANPLFVKVATGQEVTMEDLAGFAPSAVSAIQESLAAGLSVFDAVIANIARLIPEYCGQTFVECVERGYLAPVEYTDEQGNVYTVMNIMRCSEERP